MPELAEQYISSPDELVACCKQLATSEYLGLDTEFVGEETYHPHLCLLQVATEQHLVLIDPQTAGPLDRFWALITDPARLVVVHAGREEARLCQRHAGRPPGKLFDLQIAAGLVGLPYPIGHGTLVSRLLGISLSKSETLTEWRTRPLTRSQIEYAYNDVRYLIPLWKYLRDRLRALDRGGWAREEFDRLARAASPDESPEDERWRRLRGIGAMDRRRLAVVRDLYRWREEEATRSNRPARAICRDDLLVEVVRRNPRRPPDLHVVRGLARRVAEPMLEVIERARALPAVDLPRVLNREQDPPQVLLVAGILSAVLGDFCARNELAPGLVANNQDLRALVRAKADGKPLGAVGNRAGAPASLLCEGWRSRHVLPVLTEMLDGKRRLRITDVSAPAPLELDSSSDAPDSP